MNPAPFNLEQVLALDMAARPEVSPAFYAQAELIGYQGLRWTASAVTAGTWYLEAPAHNSRQAILARLDPDRFSEPGYYQVEYYSEFGVHGLGGCFSLPEAVTVVERTLAEYWAGEDTLVPGGLDDFEPYGP